MSYGGESEDKEIFRVETASEAECWRARVVKVKIRGYFGSRLHLRQCVGELRR